ncbi:MAG: class I SAM-dependent rRNA methyltransferase [Pseudomonadota bacterium]|nr:MAG: class I SAM-dependent rRNA methyltransferase [Pseudomonadota bacterium]
MGSRNLPRLRLKKGEDRRLRAGHLWVYSNEVDTANTPLKAYEAGQLAHLEDHRGSLLGTAYVNPHTLICARLLGRDADARLDAAWLKQRVARALVLRAALFEQPCYRLVYGESDGLPGLVVDRFAGVLVAQITTAGMERVRNEIVAVLEELLQPEAILLRNDTPARELEGLDTGVETVLGTLPGTVTVEENGARFEVPLAGGQKTGWYYDHRFNRARMQQYVRDKRVLDVFSYIGAWGIEALVAGAHEVTCVDGSQRMLAQARHNAALNGRGENLMAIAGDAFDVMKQLQKDGQTFDAVVLDPPAFVKRRKDLDEGALAYRRLNTQAMELLAPEGILVSASCSYHMPRERLLSEIRRAGQRARRWLQVLEQGHQGLDHPVHPAMPETDYLKSYIVRVCTP